VEKGKNKPKRGNWEKNLTSQQRTRLLKKKMEMARERHQKGGLSFRGKGKRVERRPRFKGQRNREEGTFFPEVSRKQSVQHKKKKGSKQRNKAKAVKPDRKKKIQKSSQLN